MTPPDRLSNPVYHDEGAARVYIESVDRAAALIGRPVRRPAPRRCAGSPQIRLDGRMAELLTVHDPRGYPPKVVGKRLAERPETLDGKLVYLVDCLFDNSENFMHELGDWFGKNLPFVKTRLIQPRQSWVDDAEMRAKVAREGDGAILGVGL